MNEKRSARTVLVLVLIIVLLVGFLLYFFLIAPTISGYVVNRQIEAQQMLVDNIILQIQQTGYVQIPVGNQTLVLVPYTPPAK